jgi:Flp pilus assembly protein TadG
MTNSKTNAHVVSGVARIRSERGQALIEMAITLPLLLLVTMAAVEFGRAYQHWQVLTNAAREGARIAVLPGVNDAAVENRVTTYMTSGRLSAPEEATITVTRNTEIGAGTASTVVVDYPFTFIVLQPIAQLVAGGKAVGEPLTMSASAMMRNEQ